MPHFVCTVCGHTELWPSHDQAQAAAVWHIFENHPDTWGQVVGDRPPVDPDPRKAA